MTEEGSWLYGMNPVTEAVRAGRAVTIYVVFNRSGHFGRLLTLARSHGITVKERQLDFFDKRFPKGHQGVAALVGPRRAFTLDDLMDLPGMKAEIPLFLILDGIEDPRNFGAILRVADATGVHGVVFPSRRSAGITPSVSKTSAGAIESINMVETVNVKHAIERMKDEGVTIVGAEANGPISLWNSDLSGPIALVMGSEGKGIRRTVKDMCDMVISLPMRGQIGSLNVSVACGVILYEALRQRTKTGIT